MHNALHVLEIGLTVLSIGHIIKAGYTMQFEDKLCEIKKGGSTTGSIPISANGLFKVEHALTGSAAKSPTYADILTLHHRLGHLLANSICTFICSNAVFGLYPIDNFLPFTCNLCEYAKVTCKPIHKECEAPLADYFSVEVHSDVWGPSPTLSLGGHRYYITFTNDSSCYTWIQALRTKDEAFSAYKEFAAWEKTQHGAHIKHLRSDHGSEFTSHDFTTFLKEQGTAQHLTTHDTLQHNGVAESLNC